MMRMLSAVSNHAMHLHGVVAQRSVAAMPWPLPGTNAGSGAAKKVGEVQPALASSLCGCQGGLFQHRGPGPKRGATDLQLSLGKIHDTLDADYHAFFERSPDFDIYDDSIIFDLDLDYEDGSPREALRGKKTYRRAILALQSIVSNTVRDSEIRCSVKHNPVRDEMLQVKWTCSGQTALFPVPVHISAISSYSLGRRPETFGMPTHVLSHLVCRHTVEFKEIQPPTLRKLLQGFVWPQLQPEPTLAFGIQPDFLAIEVDPQTWEALAQHA